MPARTFVLIFKRVARPNLCEPPPSQSRHPVVRNRRRGLDHQARKERFR